MDVIETLLDGVQDLLDGVVKILFEFEPLYLRETHFFNGRRLAYQLVSIGLARRFHAGLQTARVRVHQSL